MSPFNDRALTEQVLESFANTPDPRRKTLITELVLSLHEFVRKTNLTFEEWDFAIDFLTRTGQTCTAHAPGIHPAVGRARRLHAGRRGQPPLA